MFPQTKPDGANQPEPVRTLPNTFEQEWLDVEQSVAYALELGLSRTPKTIRKWAERSSGLPDGDVVARREDTPWGYRWLIEKSSLARKVEEDLELRSANLPEPVRTGSSLNTQVHIESSDVTSPVPSANLPEQAHTSSHQSAPEVTVSDEVSSPEPRSHEFAQVHTSADSEAVLDEVRERLADKDREIKFLRQQLAEAQAEGGRRAASTDEALKSLDRVVRSFELQAEANRTLALSAEQFRPEREATQPIHFDQGTVDTDSRHQDIRRV